jgi:hypothetical protein
LAVLPGKEGLVVIVDQQFLVRRERRVNYGLHDLSVDRVHPSHH